MNDTPNDNLVLLLEPTGQPGCAQLTLGEPDDRQFVIPLLENTPVLGGALRTISATGEQLGSLSETEVNKLLRHCRHLLGPGGQLSLPVGRQPDEVSHEGLGERAWLTGFTSWVDYVAGHAVMTKPRRLLSGPSLVSIVMPSYKSDFFAAALQSAQDQTWPHCEIVVCDDSPDERIAEITAASKGPHPIRYIRNPGNIGGRANYLKCYQEAHGRYIKYLNDDDLLHPDCVARMAAVLDAQPAVTLVTSHRRLIDAEDNVLPDEDFNKPLTRVDSLIDGRILATHVLTPRLNSIGEPTTAMFRKGDMADSRPHLMSYAGKSGKRNGDMFIWTSLLSRGDAVYLTDSLSDFRQHEGQVQKDPVFQVEAVEAWEDLFSDAERTGMMGYVYNIDGVSVGLDVSGEVTVGEDLFCDGHTLKAIDVFAKAVCLEPANTQARSNLACACWRMRWEQRAVTECMVAHCCDPSDETIALNLQEMLPVNA